MHTESRKMTSNIVTIAGSIFAGVIIGLLFFGGLLLTTRRFATSPHAIRLVIGSFIGRALIALGGFFIVIKLAGFTGVMLALLGFVSVQLVVLARSLGRKGS